jgi:serine/threonine protein phosphatase PrpC
MAVEHALVTDNADPDPTTWRGAVEPYEVGDPGRAARLTVPLPDHTLPDRRDTVLDGFVVMDGQDRVGDLRAASTRGLAHRHYGRVRQDEYGYRRTADGRYLVLCVADGVSAGKQSHYAATTAVSRGTAYLASLLATVPPSDIHWPGFIQEVANLVVRAGRKRLRVLGFPDADEYTDRHVAEHMATTVLYAVVDLRSGESAYPVDFVAVGDTSAWVLRQGGSWEPQQAVKNEGAELYSPAVTALPLLPAQPPQPVRTHVMPGDTLVLVSDGIGDALGAGTGEVGRFLTGVWRTPPAPLDFAAQVEFARKSFDDDRTAIAFWPSKRP